MQGFVRVSVAVPAPVITDAQQNADAIFALMQEAHDAESALVVFPELALSTYTARDLFFDAHLLNECERALLDLAERSKHLAPLALVGVPLRKNGLLYNCAVAMQSGKLLGVVPKMYLPNYREFEEKRWFRPGTEVAEGEHILIGDQTIPFGGDLIFRARGSDTFAVGAEICEDYWVQHPPSMGLCSAGAFIVANLSASNFTIGKADLRRLLARSSSDRGKCAYLYVAAGPGESSTDLAFDADAFVCENGKLLCETKRFARESQLVSTDIDIDMLSHERRSTGSFGDCASHNAKKYRTLFFDAAPEAKDLAREINPHPFLPSDEKTMSARCWEIFEIQTNALLTRMNAIGNPKLILGVSGGLDSTHAALVCAGALDLAKRPRSDLVCATMPGFGTTTTTKSNAQKLVEALGGTFLDLPVDECARMVLKSVSHEAAADSASIEDVLQKLREKPELGDTTLENAQARMRTLFLMTLANHHRGIVVGTGDLSEKALGWATYAGDHIAMYDVNAGVPKTLIQFVIRWVAREKASAWSNTSVSLTDTLESIVETPISPELLPPDKDGQIAQLTEERIGPYELHDFYLFHFVRHGARPARILDLAQAAFKTRYDLDAHKKWLTLFIKRFFANQYKRSCATDGPKVGMVALSPRGDWRMPSDAKARSWLLEIENY